jgi:hypothetical protein
VLNQSSGKGRAEKFRTLRSQIQVIAIGNNLSVRQVQSKSASSSGVQSDGISIFKKTDLIRCLSLNQPLKLLERIEFWRGEELTELQ